MDCIRSPWDVWDWRPCFRTAVLNTAVPLLGVTISIAACFINVRYSHSAIDSLDQAAQYDLGSPSTPMQHVLHTESSVILHEASSIVHEAIAYEASLPTTGHAWMDIGVCVFLVCLHAIGAWVSTYEWNVTWGLYVLFACVVCIYSWKQNTSLSFHKLALALPYTLVMCSNMRTAWMHTASTLGLVQGVAAIAVLLGLLLRRQMFPQPDRVKQLRFVHSSTGMDPASSALLKPKVLNDEPSPESFTSVLGRITFLFMTPFVWRQYFHPTTFASIPQLPAKFRAATIVARVRLATGTKRESLLARLWHVLGPSITYQLTLSFLRACFRVVPIACLSQLLTFMTLRDEANAHGISRPPPIHVGLFWASCLFAAQLTEFLLDINVMQHGRSQSVELRAYLSTELFSKILRRVVHGTPLASPASFSSSERLTDGHIASLLSVDMFKIDSFLAFLHQPLVDYPLTIIFCCIYLFRLLGVSALVGLSVLLITAPLQTQLSKLMVRLQDHILQATDARLDLVNEVLMCIKTVKFFAWETPFLERLRASRARELIMLARNNLMSITYNFIFVGMPMVVTMATFGNYTYVLGHALTPKAAFTALSIFTTLRMPLSDYPEMIVSALAAVVSVRRVDGFLRTENTHKYDQLMTTDDSAPNHHPTYLGFVDASFAYDPHDPEAFRLLNLTCRFPVGQLSMVLGPVGSGKSSLLLALLGELHRLHGSTVLPCPTARSMTLADPTTLLTESTAYCGQNAWLLGTTVRENILFGSAYDEPRYREVLRACALEPDLDILEHHDETEVGEKGTSLSGGQKARIALARAFYSYAKHILIDDALSAVDAHTGEHLLRHCFHGPLSRGRTIVLVTHAVPLVLSHATYAVILDHGRVAALGTPTDLVRAGHINSTIQYPDEQSRPLPLTVSEDKGMESKVHDAKWIEANERRARKNQNARAESIQRKARGMDLYFMYARSVAVHTSVAIGLWMLLMSLYASVRMADVFSNAWLKQWADSYSSASQALLDPVFHALDSMLAFLRSAYAAPTNPHEKATLYYLVHYIVLVVFFILLSTLRDCVQYYIALRASRLLYARLLHALLYASPRFFDITPIGRIMNRLSKDVETVDQDMTPSLRMMIEASIALAAILGIICWATPKFLYMAGFVMVMYYVIGALYLGSSRQLKRIESIERSPLFTLLGETLAGTVTIRAFSDGERVIRRCMHVLDRTHRAFLYLWYENRWLTLCVDLMGAIVTYTTAILLVITGADAALTGFTLAYAVLIVQTVLRIVRRYTTTEINLNSVERIQEYLHVPSEQQGGKKPPAHWPTDSGAIQVRDLSVRYSPELPPALSNVSFDIQPGHKVGIVGRTGSGKSTLSLAFFRFLEAESGSIIIDGIDISSISLESLRRRLTIIPQDSQLFRGSIRSNLDPFGLTDDGDMWFALQRCQLAVPGSSPNAPGEGSVIKSLDDAVEQGGSNFSAGQRQLLSLARGLLKMRESRILILDESTANLDAESDALIQRTIREQMAPGATILTVAHRLKTIIDYDKVLVLSNGHVVEYDAPIKLLDNEQSTFYALCERSGELQHLKAAAATAAASQVRPDP